MEELFYSECGYFPELKSESVLRILGKAEYMNENGVDPIQLRYFSGLNRLGFRRAHELMYFSFCPSCQKCKSIRIPTASFNPSKSQRRVLRMNADIDFSYNEENFLSEDKIALYQRYTARHKGSECSRAEAVEDLKYWNGLCEDGKPVYCGTANLEYWLGDKLVAVSVIDETDDGISSVYFYYDISSEMMKRSLGTESALVEILLCKKAELPYYYLGYYIEDLQNMRYKARFKPYELLCDGKWKVFGLDEK